MSSITSIMHQFYIEHRKHWWILDITSMFHPSSKCFCTLKPAMFHLLDIWFIDAPSMNHQWNNVESPMKNSYVSEISTLKTLKIINVCTKIINVSSMLLGCRIVVSLLNRPAFFITTLMNHQCYQCVLDWGN